MDINKWIYCARSRLNSETGRAVRCTFHGKDADSSKSNREPYEVYLGLYRQFFNPDRIVPVSEDDRRHDAVDSVNIDIPASVSCLTYSEYKLKDSADRGIQKALNAIIYKDDGHTRL